MPVPVALLALLRVLPVDALDQRAQVMGIAYDGQPPCRGIAELEGGTIIAMRPAPGPEISHHRIRPGQQAEAGLVDHPRRLLAIRRQHELRIERIEPLAAM